MREGAGGKRNKYGVERRNLEREWKEEKGESTEGEVRRAGGQTESKKLKQKVERRRNDERVEDSEKEMRQIRRQGSKNRSIKEARRGERRLRKK